MIWVEIRNSIEASADKKIGIFETHRNKHWFNQKCPELANKRKQANLLWLENPKDQTAEDLTNIRRDTCRTFKKKKCEYMKAIVNDLEENSKK